MPSRVNNRPCKFDKSVKSKHFRIKSHHGIREIRQLASSVFKLQLNLSPLGKKVFNVTIDLFIERCLSLLNEKPFEDFALEETQCCINDSKIEFMGLVLFQMSIWL